MVPRVSPSPRAATDPLQISVPATVLIDTRVGVRLRASPSPASRSVTTSVPAGTTTATLPSALRTSAGEMVTANTRGAGAGGAGVAVGPGSTAGAGVVT